VSQDDSKAYPGELAITDKLAGFGAGVARAQWNAQWSPTEFQAAFNALAAQGANVNMVSFAKSSVFKTAAEAGAGGASGHTATWKYAYGIAPVLDVTLSTNIDLDPLPQKTVSAVNYGILKPIVLTIENIAGNNKIYFTGGDGAYLMRYFRNSIYEKDLIFKSMVSLIEKKGLA